MRKLMWFSVGFATACVIGAYLLSGMWLFLLAACCGAGLLGLVWIHSRHAKIVSMVLVGCICAFLWFWGYDFFYLSHARNADTQTVETTLTATDYSYETNYGVAGDAKINFAGKTYRVRYYISSQEQILPGDSITGSFRLRYTASGGAQEPTHHHAEGVFFLAYCYDQVSISRSESIPLRYYPAVLRQRITQMLTAVFPEDTLAFARALLLGDSSLLTYQTDTAFAVSGIRHVIAVSGLHVAILFSLVYLVLGERRVLTPIVGIGILLVFAAVTGFTPSVVRACIMQGLMLLALMFNKEYDPPTALSFAVLTMLVVNPLAIRSVSLQLSAGCILGIFLFSGKIHDYLLDEKRFGPAKGKGMMPRLIRWIVGSVSVTVSAMIITTPLCAAYFGFVSLVGILTNLLTLWIISFVFYGIMLACAAGAVWLPLGQGIGWLISWPIRYVIATANLLSSFPLAAVYTCSVYVIIWLVFCYILFGIFFFSKQKRPILLACCMVISLSVALTASWLEPRQNSFRMTVLDVGQGQCVLLQNEDKYFLVDCGGDYSPEAADSAAHLLLSQGVSEIDGVILTHYDKDHAGGMDLFLSRIRTKNLYLPDIEDDSGVRELLEKQYSDRICWITQDSDMIIPEGNITVFSGGEGKSDNERSLCVLFQPENCDIMIMADRGGAGERALLERTELPDLEILVAGHHGSKHSTTLELLSATMPEAVVISVGKNNTFGHPAEELLERLDLFGCQVFRTDISGTITFRG